MHTPAKTRISFRVSDNFVRGSGSGSGGLKGDAMGSAVLGEAIGAIRDWSVVNKREPGDTRAANLFGSLVFNDAEQEKRLPKPVYHALRRTITQGEALDASVADAVASALKDWAVEHGATH